MNDMDRIAAPLQRLSELAQRRDKERELRRWAAPSCGGCYWWMKSRDCPREHNVNGMTRGPSADALPCAKFKPSKSHEDAVGRHAAFLAETF